MDLIIGGMYQGKLDYAKTHFSIADQEVFRCTDAPVLDPSMRCICGLERYLRACVREGQKPALVFRPDAVILCTDIFCGLVPESGEPRAWRVLAGRVVTSLAAQAETVTRIFCGIPQRLKPPE